jgi:hypothetical protein
MELHAKENYMHRGYRYLTSLFLTAALAAPIAMMGASPQDNRSQEERRRDNENHRYYDRNHKDYHQWDNNEDRAYQRYQTEHHQKRVFIQLNSRQQGVYWTWRHNNPDNR